MARADYRRARDLYPSCADITATEWMDLFEGPAGTAVLGRLLRDAFNVVIDEQERRDGTRLGGRRPPRFASLDVVVATVFPEKISHEPFTEAMKTVLGGRSQRAFVHNSSIHQTTLSKLMLGTYAPDMEIIERIAEIAKISPGYFAVYRAMFLSELVRVLLEERPELSSVALKDVMALRRGKS